jgi:hypothetical protein
MLRCFFLGHVLLVFAAFGYANDVAVDSDAPIVCLTTLPQSPAFVPPLPYQQKSHPGRFWFGTDSLWTNLAIDGTWNMHDVPKGKGYSEKLIYWRRGFDWRMDTQLELVVTAKRLDSESPLVAAGHASPVFVTGKKPPAIMTMINIPTAGSWEVSAQYGNETLSFVILVKP